MPVICRALVAFGSLVCAQALRAQCPDGTPPPCRAPVALNERTWLVLPFENTTHDTATALIRDASVTLLYQEMSRWQDVHVISDARVADLLRLVPATQQGRLGLTAASDLARRAGAGRVVLGSYVAVRGRANVTATVYDVRAGRQVRVVRDAIAGLESASALDSLGAAFGRISRAVLAVPGTAGAGGGIGTASIEAYRAYFAAMGAANRLRRDSARILVEHAVSHDSDFALARLRAWQWSPDTAAGRRHLLAAIRLAEGLPPAERLLVEGWAASNRNDYEQLCRAANQLVRDDSTSSDGWVLLANCYADARVVREGGLVRLRSDPNRALRAAERAYALAPTSGEAFFELLAMTTFNGALHGITGANPETYRMVCGAPPPGPCPPDRFFRIALVPVADSFVVMTQSWAEAKREPAGLDSAAFVGWEARYRAARLALSRYQESAPDSWILNWVSTVLSGFLGDTAAAARTVGRGAIAAIDTGSFRIPSLITALYLALARGRTAEARAYADTMRARGAGAVFQSLFGRYTENPATPAGRETGAWRQVYSGVLPPGFDTLEARIAARLVGPQRDDFLQLTTLAAFHMRRTGPALDTAAAHPVKRAQAWLARGDRGRARAALAEFDRELAGRHLLRGDDGGFLFAAELHAALGDSAAALETLRRFARRWVHIGVFHRLILEQRYFEAPSARLWGRTWMLYGDVAMALGAHADARRAYTMVVGLWEDGEPIVQPLVARARAALAQ